MPEAVNHVVFQFSRELKRMLGERLVRVVLYGSGCSVWFLCQRNIPR